MGPHSGDGQKPMFHDAVLADHPDQLGEMAASLREEKDRLVA